MTDVHHHYHFHFGRAAEADRKIDAILGAIGSLRKEIEMARAAVTAQSGEIDKLATVLGTIFDELTQAQADLKAALAAQSVDDSADIQANTDKIDALLARAQGLIPTPTQPAVPPPSG